MAPLRLTPFTLAGLTAGAVLGLAAGPAAAAVPARSTPASSAASLSAQQWRSINTVRVYAAINTERRKHHLQPLSSNATTRIHVTRAQRRVQAALDQGAGYLSIHRRWLSLGGDCGGGQSNAGPEAFGATTIVAHLKQDGDWKILTTTPSHFSMGYAARGQVSVVAYDIH